MKYSRESLIKLILENNLRSIKDFRAHAPAAYLWWTRNKHLIGELPLAYKKRPNNCLSKEDCAKIALQYQHRSDLQTKDKGVYLKALRNGWLDEICAHMVPKPFVFAGGNPGRPAHNRIDLTGQVFGKWTVLHKAGVGKKYGWICRCECGTEAEVSAGNLRQGLTTKCASCSNQVSQPMKEIWQFVKDLGFDAQLSYKDLGFEIDVYVPEKQFFIEYDGLLWHSSKFRASAPAEKERYKRLKEHGLTGMRIFEDQYLQNKDLVFSMIAHRLGKGSSRKPEGIIYGIVKTPSAYKQFCKENHLDGYGKSKWAVVAADKHGTTLAFMGFRAYLSGKYKGQPELSRFCTNRAFNCYGLFGKMLKLAIQHIKEQNLGVTVVSASDNHISDGKVYANNGFELGPTSDSWFYYLHSKGQRLHRTAGKRLNPPFISAEEFALYPTEKTQTESGFTAYKKWGKWEPMYKVWGWGHKLWIRHLK